MIPYSTQLIDQDDIDAVTKVLSGSHLTQGHEVSTFEEALCNYTGAKYAVAFNSATSALLASYSIVGIKETDEIITTPISFVATSNMAVALDAVQIFCDIKLDGNIDERFIERLITPKTKAIVPIDFAGKPVELDTITAIAKKHNLIIIEDASHALGSTYKNRKVGNIADMTIFSFHAIKSITTGEGGAVLTNNEAYAEKLRLFRSHGMVKKQFWNSDMISMGYNFRMSEVGGSLGLTQLKKLDGFIKVREEIARYYDDRFKDAKLFITTKIKENTTSSRHLYPIILNPELQCPKEDIFRELQESGLGVQVHYKPIYQNSFYKERFGNRSLEVANDFYRSEISLPCHQKMSMQDAKFVADTFLSIIQKYSHRGCSF